jgi:hypothetical protein
MREVYAISVSICSSFNAPAVVGAANQNGCITLCVGNLADENFQAFNDVSCMKFLGTVVHRLTELQPNHCQHRGNIYHNYIFK